MATLNYKLDALAQATNGAALPRVRSGKAGNGYSVKMGRVYTFTGKKSTAATAYRVFGMLDAGAVDYAAQGYEVHHIDGDHTNNRRGNCLTVTKELHTFIHQTMTVLCNESPFNYGTAQSMKTINTRATHIALALWAEMHK